MSDVRQRSASTHLEGTSTQSDPRGVPLPEEAQILERLAPTLEKLPASDRQIVVKMIEETVTHSGMMPPPSYMAGYAELYPDAPAKFFEYADRQVASIEARVTADIKGEQDQRDKNQTYRVTGLIVGAFVSVSLIGAGATVAIMANAPITGGLVSVVGVAAGLAGVFVQGRPLMDRTAPPADPPAKAPAKSQANRAGNVGPRRNSKSVRK